MMIWSMISIEGLHFIIYVIFDINKEISSKEFWGTWTPYFLALRM